MTIRKNISLTLTSLLFLALSLTVYSSVRAASTIAIDELYTPPSEVTSYQEGTPFNMNGSTTPTADVTITVTTDSQCEVKPVSSGSWSNSVVYAYTSGGWPDYSTSVAMLRAVQDLVDEGTHSCTVSYSLSSSDLNYNGVSGQKVYSVTDNDKVGVSIKSSSDGAKEGGVSNFSFINYGQPNSTVTFTMTATGDCNIVDVSGGGKGGGEVTYSNPTKSKSYTHETGYSNDRIIGVYVQMTDDSTYKTGQKCSISGASSSADTRYNGLSVPTQTFSITDNDTPTTDKTTSAGTTQETPKQESTQEDKPATETIFTDGIKVKNDKGEELDVQKQFSLEKGKELVFEGTTTPNTKVTITIYSDPMEFTTTSDETGYYKIVATGMPEGDHHAELVITDPETNETSEPVTVAQFSVKSADTSTTDPRTSDPLLADNDESSNNMLYIVAGIVVIVVASGAGGFWWWRRRKASSPLMRF